MIQFPGVVKKIDVRQPVPAGGCPRQNMPCAQQGNIEPFAIIRHQACTRWDQIADGVELLVLLRGTFQKDLSDLEAFPIRHANPA